MPSRPKDSYHYNAIARAIKIIDAEKDGKLPLAGLAARMDRIPSRFRRVFSQWAGVSPKQDHQSLTLQHARLLPRSKFTAPHAAENLRLSGPGRLRDFFLRWEAMSPGVCAKVDAELAFYCARRFQLAIGAGGRDQWFRRSA